MTSKLESKDTSRVAAHVHTVSAALPPPPPTESSVTTTEGAVASSGRAQNHASQSQKDYQQGTKHLSISMPDLQTWDDQTPKLSTSSAGAAGNEAQTEPPSTTSQSPTLVHRQGKEDSWLENEWDDAVVEAERVRRIWGRKALGSEYQYLTFSCMRCRDSIQRRNAIRSVTFLD